MGFFMTGAMLTEGVSCPGSGLERTPGFRGTAPLGSLTKSKGRFEMRVIGLVSPLGSFTNTVLLTRDPEEP